MNLRILKHWLRWACCVLLLLIASISYAQSNQAEYIKASYLFNFCENVTWANEGEITEFKIGIVDAPLVSEYLKKIVETNPIKGKRAKVISYDQYSAVGNVDMLYVAPSQNRLVDKIYDDLRDANCLLVTDGAKNLHMINFQIKESLLRFDLNNENLVAAGFAVSSKLKVIGGSDLEALQIIGATQASLKKERAKLDKAKAELLAKEKRIADLNGDINSKDKTIDELEKRRLSTLAAIEEYENKAGNQRFELAEMKLQIDSMEQSLATLKSTNDGRRTQMLQLEEEYAMQQKRIADNNKVLEEQQQQLANQQADLASKEDKIETQGQFLILSLVFLAVVIVLSYFIYREYQHKTKANAIIAQQADLVEQGARQKEDFLANMSHEIRTPMNAIIGFTNLMLKLSLPGKQEEYLENIKISSRNLLNIINDILDLSKIEAGKIDIEKIHFDLPKILKNVTTSLQVTANEKDIKLKLNDFTAPPFVIGDPTRLSQVLLNLLSNAIKFTENGSVEMRVERVESTEDELLVKFSVIDTGIGVAEEKIDEIFEKFTQSDQSVTRKYGGTGLGLPISKKLVELLGGKLQVDSKVGEGSTFFFTLTYGIGDVNQINKDVNTEVTIDGIEKMRVVLADDYGINRQMTAELFRQWNEDVEFAAVSNGVELLKLMETDPYDVILMDVHMPVMDGIEATEKLRNEMKSDVVIIGLSANALKRDKEQCLAAGMNDYVTKPFELNEVLSKIARHLGLKMERIEAERRRAGKGGLQRMINLSKVYKMSKDLHEVKELVVGLLGDISTDMESLKASMESRDLDAVQTEAHNIVNKAIYVGSQEFELQCRKLERTVKDGEAEEEIVELVQELDGMWNEIGQALEEHVEAIEV